MLLSFYQLGLRKFNFASGVSVSTTDARTILDAKDLTIEQGTSYTDVIFSGEGVLSNLGSASLQSLSDFLAEGLGLRYNFYSRICRCTCPCATRYYVSSGHHLANDDRNDN